jgi:hypothetical protein
MWYIEIVAVSRNFIKSADDLNLFRRLYRDWIKEGKVDYILYSDTGETVGLLFANRMKKSRLLHKAFPRSLLDEYAA